MYSEIGIINCTLVICVFKYSSSTGFYPDGHVHVVLYIKIAALCANRKHKFVGDLDFY